MCVSSFMAACLFRRCVYDRPGYLMVLAVALRVNVFVTSCLYSAMTELTRVT